MPIHGYQGNVISGTPPSVSPTSASGVWTLDDQLQNAANWPSQSNIARSLRFNFADSATLTRTPGTAGNRRTWTWSAWVKRSNLGYNHLLNCSQNIGASDSQLFQLAFNTSDKLYIFQYNPSTIQMDLQTTAVYRDVSAWYHIVLAYDTTQATASDRVKLYVNGVQVTSFSTATYPAQNSEGYINNNIPHVFGQYAGTSAGLYLGAYIADMYLIDGQALTPSSFGYTDSNGIWQPNSYTGSYGTNGFWLNFDDNSGTTATTLGKDSSGNGNNWTPNNFSVTAGAGNDSLVDSPTNYGTDTGVGGEVRGNYATLNPLPAGNVIAPSDGNLQAYLTAGTNAYWSSPATIAITSGKWYWECSITARDSGAGQWIQFGIVATTTTYTNNALGYSGNMSNGYAYYNDASKAGQSAISSYGATFTTGDVIGVAFDADAGTLTFYKNGASQGQAFSGISTSTAWLPIIQIYRSGGTGQIAWINFGQRPFAYTAPAGFKALCSTNLPTPTIQKGADYFNIGLWTGNFSASNIPVTGIGFQPNFFWGKLRSAATGNRLIDSIRGVTKILSSNSNALESTETDAFASFDTDGFTIGKDTTGGGLNYNANTGVGWVWKGGGTGVSNTSGTITSTISANPTAGFSIVTYTGNGTAGATVGHGLGAVPSMIILKKRSGGATTNWPVYQTDLGNTKYLDLNSTNSASTDISRWNNTSPTSTVFTVGDAGGVNGSGFTYVAYCFAQIAGYSAFGSYTGNGSTDGPLVYTGFRPAYLMYKRTDSTGAWYIVDAKRNTENTMGRYLLPNASDAEVNDPPLVDFLSNGFKVRNTYASLNASGGTYVYAAFAENPFKIARAR